MAKHVRQEKVRSVSRTGRVIKSIFDDILLTGIVLCVFALFHHVIPRVTALIGAPKQVTPTAIVTPAPVTPAPTEEPTVQPTDEPTAEPEVTPEPVIDDRTEWQKTFEEYFTDTVVETENSYSSPDVAVEITTYEETINGHKQTYYVADIHIARIENFRTAAAPNGFTAYSSKSAVKMDEETNAIVQVNGDYCNVQHSGILVRNGEVYYTDVSENDICVLYYDGTVETYTPGSYDPQEIIDALPYQIWKFGPVLLDENGEPCTTFNSTLKADNPRTGLGYYEPGHYCFVVVDGRQKHSLGMTLAEFSQLFKDLGCTRAYNMDGGASSVMTFNNAIYNKQSMNRFLGDTLYICELPTETESSAVAEEEGQ